MSATTDPAVEVQGLRVTFRRWGQVVHAVDGVDLRIDRGQWTLLVGHNGSGKTTLLRALAGVQAPTEGSLRVAGAPLAGDARRRRMQVYLVRQDPRHGTAPMLTLFENLLAADPNTRGVSRKALVARYAARLAPVGLDVRLHQVVGSLSGGERQLLALHVAAMQPAPVLLLDEPFAALDPQRVEQALALLTGLRDAGRTLIQVSHDAGHIETLGDRVVRLAAGAVVEDISRPSTSTPAESSR